MQLTRPALPIPRLHQLRRSLSLSLRRPRLTTPVALSGGGGTAVLTGLVLVLVGLPLVLPVILLGVGGAAVAAGLKLGRWPARGRHRHSARNPKPAVS